MPHDPTPDTRFLKAAQLFEEHLPAYVTALKANGIADPLVLARVLIHYGYGVTREVSGSAALIDALETHLRQLRSEAPAGGSWDGGAQT